MSTDNESRGIVYPPDVETVIVPRDLLVECLHHLRHEIDARVLLGELCYVLRQDTEARLAPAEPAGASRGPKMVYDQGFKDGKAAAEPAGKDH